MMPSGEQTVARRLAAAAQPPLRLAGELLLRRRARGKEGIEEYAGLIGTPARS
jgi:hypothetical protein